jgi:hypothetical protein
VKRTTGEVGETAQGKCINGKMVLQSDAQRSALRVGSGRWGVQLVKRGDAMSVESNPRFNHSSHFKFCAKFERAEASVQISCGFVHDTFVEPYSNPGIFLNLKAD